jgi:alkylation response protein AidB-like acyl-CoA dehydrogenase
VDGYREALDQVVTQVVAPSADRVDRQGAFPSEAVAALGRHGLLGLTVDPAMGGGGRGLREAAEVIEGLARACGSTAMVTLMHYAATAVLEAHGPEEVRRRIAAGEHLSTLAFSEPGSRSHFWHSDSTATPDDGGYRLYGEKSWVTSAAAADSYVFSTRPAAGEGPMSLWLVPTSSEGLEPKGSFDGLGLRGNGSTPVGATGVRVGADALLGPDGGGLDVALAVVLPWFLVLSAAFSLGLMESVTAEATAHLTTTRLEHLDRTLITQPLVRVDLARARVATDATRALLEATLRAVEEGRPDAVLTVLESKAAAAEAALEVTDRAMKVCGGAAFRRELGVERAFRDARAARVMAPTTDALLDFIGRAIGGLPLFDP